MAKFHFVEDYERYVADLIRQHPIDTAMSLAVGGSYASVGAIECEILLHAGLEPGMAVVDLGCGSGRLAVALANRIAVGYLGLDVVPALLDYARTKAPKAYRFVLNRALSLPVEAASVDVLCAFSVFTHLLHAETYLYLEDAHRALRPGGRVVLSFLEFAIPDHWAVFDRTIQAQRASTVPHLNQFIERNQIIVWSQRLGYAGVSFIDGNTAPWPSGEPLGQSIAILTKG
ncbi:MAG: methyltransferase domain-containing protein [Methylobacterium sp.]|uniref:class I SAM-dependent methyltransferase n=1 Tax=unclassified Methylobacterium TaxID=2615210 RepID=UPI0011CC0636|nr:MULTISPECIES: class I SAM-dependent methyltransferase [unclassified Methylobacterium]MDO9426377.1 methyltransferase domain-containing protein [Methylobacterium sp.]TXM79125.1 methyltransferase domain-containing protein [Methylobacterium sp. WL69]